uniref:Sulfotransferase n=1 Tax=Branchiostoma floridae TaxID=7739 RepID=C3ZH41_BRAFL|eukprot:XP_002592177.1 hypothetical protein BRAFLDRAFT_88099 [Branchiostoma floridae]
MALHQYKGILFPDTISKDTLDVIPDYPVRDDDIFILTYPKSGMYGDFYDHALGWWKMKDDHHFLFLKYEDMKKDLRSVVGDVAAFLETSLDKVTVDSIAESCTFNTLKAAWGSSDDALKKHLCRKGTNWIMEVVKKVMNAAGKMATPDEHSTWCIEMYVPGKDEKPRHVLAMDSPSPRIIHTHLPRQLAPKMVANPEGKDLRSVVSDVAVFLHTSLDQATVDSIAESCTFNSLKAAWGNSDDATKKHICRKGVVGDWKSMFTPEQNAAYDAKHKLRLEGTGLQFDFE